MVLQQGQVMIDLKPIIINAMERGDEWQPSAVLTALQAVSSLVSGSSIDWEEGDEEWARVISDEGTVLALVCGRIPFGFICLPDVDMKRLPTSIDWVQVSDITVGAFAVDKKLLESAFARELSDNIDYGSFSPQDLWWATV